MVNPAVFEIQEDNVIIVELESWKLKKCAKY